MEIEPRQGFLLLWFAQLVILIIAEHKDRISAEQCFPLFTKYRIV
jgi:hypothetical protein